MSLGTGWIAGAFAGALSGFFGRGQHSVCECICAGTHDQGLVQLLAKQLDRCGPPNLAPSCPECRCSPCPQLAPLLALVFSHTCCVAIGFALCWLARRGPTAGSSPNSAALQQAQTSSRAAVQFSQGSLPSLALQESPAAASGFPVTPAAKRALK